MQEQCPHFCRSIENLVGLVMMNQLEPPNDVNNAIEMLLWDKELNAFIKGQTQFT